MLDLLHGPGKQLAHHCVHSEPSQMPNVIDCLSTFVHMSPSLPLRWLHQSLPYPSLFLLFSCGWTSCSFLHVAALTSILRCLPPSIHCRCPTAYHSIAPSHTHLSLHALSHISLALAWLVILIHGLAILLSCIIARPHRWEDHLHRRSRL